MNPTTTALIDVFRDTRSVDV